MSSFHCFSDLSASGSSHPTLLWQRVWNSNFNLMTNGLSNPKGSNILAVTFNKDLRLLGNLPTRLISSEKQNVNSSETLFHMVPSNLHWSVDCLSPPTIKWEGASSPPCSLSFVTKPLTGCPEDEAILERSSGNLNSIFLNLSPPPT